MSQSIKFREKGNECYKRAYVCGLNSCVQIMRLKEAITWYEKAKASSCNNDERCSALKNIAVACKKIALLLGDSYDRLMERQYYFNESLQNFDEAFDLMSCKSHEWVDNLIMIYSETTQQAIDDLEEVEFKEKIFILNHYAKNINNAHYLRAELYLEIARLHFGKGINAMVKKDYKKCLYEMHECHYPAEEARKYEVDNESSISRELRVLDDDILTYISMAESCQARQKGDDILHEITKNEENLNMEMVWKVVDCYLEAILLAREIDVEVEAIALSRLGSIYDKVIKDKLRAKGYFTRSVQLAMSLQPRTFDNQGWFKECNRTLERYQKDFLLQENENWNEQRKKYSEELAEELKIIDEKKDEGDEALLKHIYENHPPKNEKFKLGPLPNKGDKNYSETMRQLFRSACIHYHTDKVDVKKDGMQWKVLCEEINKHVTSRYEVYKEIAKKH